MNYSPYLSMMNISKSFPGVKALDKVSFQAESGEVHALLGENGAGKSTLIKILGGIISKDEGQILINGNEINLSGVKSATNHGISIIHQELCLAPNITAAENIFLGKEIVKKNGRLDKKAIYRQAQEVFDSYGLKVNVKATVSSLTIAQQQMVEVAKALSYNSKIIVMDEPTASLTNAEVEKLFDAIRLLKSKGVLIIYISHRLDELFEICDRVTILRDGEYISTQNMADVDRQQLVSMMVGREMTDFFEKPDIEPGEVILKVSDLKSNNGVSNVTFDLRKGEILGFYGLIGSGRTETMRVLFGIDKKVSGKVMLFGKEVDFRRPSQAIKKGIALVPEDRKGQGGVLLQTVAYNIVLGILEKFISLFKVDKAARRSIVDSYIEKLRIKVSSPQQMMQNLSGGNQQKVVLAKWLATKPKILILDEPTRGIDVGAKKEIYHIMSELVKEGVSIILVSSELPEIINMSTRVVTMYCGGVTSVIEDENFTQAEIYVNATGGEKSDER